MERLIIDSEGQLTEEPKVITLETKAGDAKADLVTDAEQKGMLNGQKLASSVAGVEKLEPQTREQEIKKTFLQKVGSFFGMKTPEEYEVIGVQAIQAHPAKSQMYNKYLKEDPVKASLYAQAVGSDPDIKYWGWDEKKNKFVETGTFGVAAGEGTTGA